jgi:hypothetical protein
MKTISWMEGVLSSFCNISPQIVQRSTKENDNQPTEILHSEESSPAAVCVEREYVSLEIPLDVTLDCARVFWSMDLNLMCLQLDTEAVLSFRSASLRSRTPVNCPSV